ncbi:M48 family metallopeptidase [Sulfurimonas sp. HSL-1716]|uniref:M48 family metallopeptidase n=1 Tax=Hydrocurvibacter sulfurireducens TaxID=3131937 RepID=UPI0031F8C8B4
MLMTIITLYSFYVLINLYVSVMQIGYIAQAKKKAPVLMECDEYVKAADYAIAKERLSIANTIVDYMTVLIWIGFGIAYLSNNLFIANEALKSVAVVLGFVLINSLISLPFSIYEKFVLDEKFGFNKSTAGQFIKDTLVTLVLSILFGGLVVWGVYLIMTTLQFWWLWSFVFIFGVMILINMFFPTVRAMFFDKLTPLEDEKLAQEIKALMDKTGFVSSGVFISDASKRDARLNAYFGGLGKTKRVVLFDTLLQKLEPKELLAVLGHELGHFAHGDIYKNIALVGVMLFAMFALFGNLPQNLYLEMGLSPSPYIIMILFLIFMPVLSFVMMPVMGILSRHNEYEADKMGAQLGGASGEIELANALKKLVTENKSFPLSHPVYIFFHYTHPPVIERLKALGVDIADADTGALEGACPNID